MPDFPNELVIEILSRLPAKSLGKFKCVSKPWLNLISSERFIKTHLDLASGRDDYRHNRLILMEHSSHGVFLHELRSVSSLLHEPASETNTDTVLDDAFRVFPFPHGWPSLFVGSCNGLVCVSNLITDFFLCNPCTKKYTKLPNMRSKKCHYLLKNFGFGYDALNDDYKVVALCTLCNRNSNGSNLDHKIIVYSLKNNAWCEKKDLNIGNPSLSIGHYLNYASGKLHWPVFDSSDSWKIASFDLVSETYEVMDRPNNKEGLCDYGLGVLGGCLSVFYEYERTHADLWIMKDYGVNESWTKVVSIPYVYHPHEDPFKRSQFVCASIDGEILFILHSELLLYNPKTNTFRTYPQIGCLRNMIMYVESLFFPDIHDSVADSCIKMEEKGSGKSKFC